MDYKPYYAKFSAIYDECYNDIEKMMKDKGVDRLEIPCDEDYGYDKVTTYDDYYGCSEEKEVAVVELAYGVLFFENENEHSYEVRDVIRGSNIVDLYDIVYRALYENN